MFSFLMSSRGVFPVNVTGRDTLLTWDFQGHRDGGVGCYRVVCGEGRAFFML